jgi:murein L,D-transpeptidase YafK
MYHEIIPSISYQLHKIILVFIFFFTPFHHACFGFNEVDQAQVKMIKAELIKQFPTQKEWLEAQFAHERVAAAYATHWHRAMQLLTAKNLSPQNLDLLMVAYKQEAVLELWGRQGNDQPYQLLKSYPFCTNSGQLGPKRCEGDRQIPEGFYQISAFNPKSRFHLSLRVSYPNPSDLKHACPNKPGSDIMVHGGCSSIGCIAITDDLIKEVYLLALYAQTQKSKLNLYIFPSRFDEAFMQNQQVIAQSLSTDWISSEALIAFWQTLKTAHDQFSANHLPIIYRVNAKGDYEITQQKK